MEKYRIESIFIEPIEELRVQKEISMQQVAQTAWPNLADANRRYRFLVNRSSPTGRPLRLTLNDCLGLARAVMEDPSHVVWEATMRLASEVSHGSNQHPQQ
ncbi:MAG: hypothetical protein WC117_01165 [Sphaerochaetaceae bacterium]